MYILSKETLIYWGLIDHFMMKVSPSKPLSQQITNINYALVSCTLLPHPFTYLGAAVRTMLTWLVGSTTFWSSTHCDKNWMELTIQMMSLHWQNNSK